MKNQSQTRKDFEVNNSVPEDDGQKGSNTQNYSGKYIPPGDSDLGEAQQIPEKQEDGISESDKMLLDYAHLTFLY